MRWTLVLTQTARAMWRDGMTSSEIAHRFGCSRSAICGKMHRLGERKTVEKAMPRSIWTPERRRAASEAAKRRWAERRAAEEAEWQRQRQGVLGKVRTARYAKAREMDELAAKWRVAKAAVEEMDKAINLLADLTPLLRKHGISGEL